MLPGSPGGPRMTPCPGGPGEPRTPRSPLGPGGPGCPLNPGLPKKPVAPVAPGGPGGPETFQQCSSVAHYTRYQSINLVKAKGPIGHLHRSKIHDIKYINTHKHMLLRVT